MEAEHDVAACARKRMSRRHFFGVLGGAAVAIAQPVRPPGDGSLFNPVQDLAAQYKRRKLLLRQFVVTDVHESASELTLYLWPAPLVAGEVLASVRADHPGLHPMPWMSGRPLTKGDVFTIEGQYLLHPVTGKPFSLPEIADLSLSDIADVPRRKAA